MDTAIITRRKPVCEPRKITADHYMVDSSTHTLVAYNVSRDEHDHWRCDCLGCYYGRLCKHLSAVLALVALTEAPELADDLAAIAAHIEEGGPEPPFSLVYSDGTPKPYTREDSPVMMIRKAQATWRYTDGEVA